MGGLGLHMLPTKILGFHWRNAERIWAAISPAFNGGRIGVDCNVCYAIAVLFAFLIYDQTRCTVFAALFCCLPTLYIPHCEDM